MPHQRRKSTVVCDPVVHYGAGHWSVSLPARHERRGCSSSSQLCYNDMVTLGAAATWEACSIYPATSWQLDDVNRLDFFLWRCSCACRCIC